jgi:hypothetical protein
MKKAVKILLMVGMVACLFLGTAQATTIPYNDIYANWPGYPQAPYPVNPADQIGSYPTISGASITFNQTTRALESIVVDITNLRHTEVLFVNLGWDPNTEPYDNWDFIVNAGSDVMDVIGAFSPSDYILVDVPPVIGHEGWRVGHPFSIQSNRLADIGDVSRIIGPTTLTFNFDKGFVPILGDKFVFGMSMDCGNDVFLTPVPEPLSLLLLGLGLLGVVGLGRKVRKIS